MAPTSTQSQSRRRSRSQTKTHARNVPNSNRFAIKQLKKLLSKMSLKLIIYAPLKITQDQQRSPQWRSKPSGRLHFLGALPRTHNHNLAQKKGSEGWSRKPFTVQWSLPLENNACQLGSCRRCISQKNERKTLKNQHPDRHTRVHSSSNPHKLDPRSGATSIYTYILYIHAFIG